MEALDVYGGLAAFVSGAFEWYLEDSDTDILPALQYLCLDDDSMYGYGTNEGFLSLRQRSGHPVNILSQEEFNEIMAANWRH